jgi:AcrR family transcriptional regulator
MPDLRQKQKQRREQAIMKAAEELIAEKGYRNTSIEEIAAKAEVGPATVYNYFTSKAGIIMAIFNQLVASFVKKGQKIVGNPPARAEDALFQLIESYFKKIFAFDNKQMLREIFVVILVEQNSVRKDLMGLDYILMDQIIGLLKTDRYKSQIKPELNIQEAVLTIYILVMGDLFAFVLDDDMTFEGMMALIKRQISLFFAGLAPQQ